MRAVQGTSTMGSSSPREDPHRLRPAHERRPRSLRSSAARCAQTPRSSPLSAAQLVFVPCVTNSLYIDCRHRQHCRQSHLCPQGQPCGRSKHLPPHSLLHPAQYYKKLGVQTGGGLLSIAEYKSIRYVLCCPIRPAHIFCVRYHSFFPGLTAEFPIVIKKASLSGR
jgi:hypothetical protein